MIQAIVFLPLIGAIIAGLISIFGAHARNPSGDAVEHHAHRAMVRPRTPSLRCRDAPSFMHA